MLLPCCCILERPEALEAAVAFMRQMPGFPVSSFPDDVSRLADFVPDADLAPIGTNPVELAVVFGGDGTCCGQRNGLSP